MQRWKWRAEDAAAAGARVAMGTQWRKGPHWDGLGATGAKRQDPGSPSAPGEGGSIQDQMPALGHANAQSWAVPVGEDGEGGSWKARGL